MLTLRHQRRFYQPRLPHFIFVDGLYAGTMHGDSIDIPIPSGLHQLRVQCGGRIPLGKSGRSIDLSVSGTHTIDTPRVRRHRTVGDEPFVIVDFHDRERLWNILFDIDLIAWIVSLFVTFPPIYRILSDAFFVLWIIRLIIIRKRYYHFKTTTRSLPQTAISSD